MRAYGQHPLPALTVAHVSDTHLLAGRPLYGQVDTREQLDRALARLEGLELPPQVLVFTGDLADRGDPEAYALLRAAVEPVAQRLGALVVWTMGNHDDRAAYARGLFDRDAADDEPQDRVDVVDGLRVVSLDTSVPGHHHGELDDGQLAWLADVLAEPAPRGTLLAMHHPPIPTPANRAAAVIELARQDRLAAVLAGTDVRAILGGHFHYTSWSTFAGIPVSVASSTCYAADTAPIGRLLSGVDGHQSFTLLHVYDDQIVHTVVPTTPAAEINGYESDLEREIEALSDEEIHDLLARKDSPVWAREEPAEG